MGITSKEEDTVPDSLKWEKNFKESVKYEDGRYQVTFPMKENYPKITSNFRAARNRLEKTLKFLIREGIMEEYDVIIQDQLKNGIVEPVNWKVKEDDHLVHYLAHFPHIRRDRETSKVRIVYDASAKSQGGLSLNELVYCGTNYLRDIVGIILRFRSYKNVMISDIEKAFLQVGLQSQDRDVTRFLWLKNIKNPVLQDNIQVYRFTRVSIWNHSVPISTGSYNQASLGFFPWRTLA